jgi:hypothetical protein
MAVEKKYADVMAELARQYYEKKISKETYRVKRKLLLEYMEDEFNGDVTVGNITQT